MPSMILRRLAVAAVLGAAAQAAAQEPDEPTPAPAPPTPEELARRIKALERENRELREDLAYESQRVDRLLPIAGRISGYLDFGFFDVQGNGSGIRPDIGYRHFPEYRSQIADTWVFMGDPLSTAINSRGDPADTDGSLAITFDPVDSEGHPTFLVNALNLTLFAGIGESLTLNALVDFLPRGRDPSDPTGLFLGDYLDVKLAYVEWLLPGERVPMSLYAGKLDSVVGLEYRSQEAPDRLTVTPSLICRYTCGHPLGIKLRSRFLDQALILNLALTNGSSFSEAFAFADELDANAMKTASARLSYRFPVGRGFELGWSGAVGAQDQTDASGVWQWHVGADAHLEWRELEVMAEWVKGKAPGDEDPGGPPCGAAPCLTYQGAYLLAGYRATNWLIPYARVDWRDALHRAGNDFVYISKLARATAGVRFEIGDHVILKAEYVLDRELGRIPQIPNDVFTSAMIVKY
jgi:hypothetical protein